MLGAMDRVIKSNQNCFQSLMLLKKSYKNQARKWFWQVAGVGL